MIILCEQLRRILDSQLCGTAITQVSGSKFIWITAMTARFICGGTGEILIDGLAWRVGYWGDRAELAMMAELAAILKK